MNRSWSVAVGGLVVVAVVGGAVLLTRTASDESGGGATLLSSRAPAVSPPTFGTQDGAAPADASRPLQAATLTPATGNPGAAAAAPAASARPTGAAVTVTGRVVDPSGRPVPDAHVTLVTDPFRLALGRGPFGSRMPAGDAPPQVQTGRDGRFTLQGNLPAPTDERGLPLPEASPQLIVQQDVFATLVHPIEKLQAPGTDVGDLPLAAGAWITGRVVDESSRPLSGAHVSARNVDERAHNGPLLGALFNGLSESLDQATTGPDGRFRVNGLLPGKADLSATAEGRRLAEVQDIELQAGVPKDVGDVSLKLGQSIAGVVLDGDGHPVEAATVTVSSMARLVVNRIEDLPRGQIGQEFGQRSVTGADGRFEISGLAGGQYTVNVSADGFDRLSRDDVPAGTRDLRLVPVRLGGLFVEIDSEGDGQPVKGARIKATPVVEELPFARPDDQLLPVLVGQPALDAAGRKGDPAGAYFVQHAGLRGTKLVVAADGFATREVDGPAVDAAATGTLTVHLVPESVVAGHVQRADGTPIQGASVTLAAPRADDGNGPFRGPGMRRSFRISADGGTPANAELDAKRMTTQTMADGSFELRGAAPGDWELTATHPDHVDSAPLALALTAGQSRRDLVVTLQPAGIVMGKVTESDGTPSPDIEVTVTPSTVPSAPSGQQDVDVKATVGRMLQIDDGTGRRFARTGSDGTYRVAGLAAGSYDVALGGSGRRGRSFGRGGMMFAFAGAGDSSAQPPQTVKVLPGQESRADFVRPRRGSVTGRVIAGGRPVPDQPVTMRKAAQPGAFSLPGFGGDEERTDDSGLFTFADIEAGEYDLSTQVRGAALEQTAHVKLEPGDARTADLVFGGSTLTGRVLDKETNAGAGGVTLTVVPVNDAPSGSAPSGGGQPRATMAFVIASDTGGAPGGMSIDIGNGPAHVIRSDEKGDFQLLWVKPGKYRIEASGGGYTHAQTDPFEVADGQNKDDLEVKVQRGAIVQGSVVSGATGERLDSVPVRLEGADSREMTVTKNGSYRFEGLAAGSYTVTVLGSGFDVGPGGGDSSLASEKVELGQGEVKSLDLKTKT